MRDVAAVIMIALATTITSQLAAMQPLDDQDLSSVDAGDGVSVEFSSVAGVGASQIKWVTDNNELNDGSCSGGISGQHACTQLNDIHVTGVNGPLYMEAELDVGADGIGNPHIALGAAWSRQRVVIGGMTFNTAAMNAEGQSLGQFAIESEGQFSLVNRGGLFNNAGDFASLSLQGSADIIYRQGGAGAAELSFSDLVFDMAFTNGAAGGHAPALGRFAIDDAGILLAGSNVDVELTFDLAFKSYPTEFDTAGRSSIMRFGWAGGLINPLQRLASGGYGYGTYMNGANTFQDFDGSQTGSRSQGFNILSQWDFDSDFALVIGEGGGNRSFVRFSDWRRFGGVAGPMFSFPVIFDVVQGVSAPAGLCAGPFTSGVANESSCTGAGGEFYQSGLEAGDAAFAVLIRDAHLHAYSTLIEVTDPLAGGMVTPINWGILFTYGKLDADIFLRPEGRSQGVPVASTNTGIRADVTLLAQSPDAWRRANSASPVVRATAGDGWRTNTHVMLADTNSPIGSGHNGVGFANGDIIYRARDLYIRVVDGDTGYPELPGGLWLQTDSLAQYRFRGLFGGGDLNDLSYSALTKVSLIDVNLETDRFIFVLNPLPVDEETGAAPTGFNGLLDFNGSSYITVGEVSSPQSQFFVRDVSGRIGWKDGSLAFVSGQNTVDGLPQLVIRNDLVIGESAHFGGPMGQPLIGTVGFGTEDFGRLAIPAGTWSSEVIMKIPD